MVVAVSVRLSEGKTMASDGCRSGLQQGLVQVGRQRGALGSKQGGNRVRAKCGWFGLKQGQRRDMRMQHRDVLERKAANVATFKPNVATFHRVIKTNVVTLRSNVATLRSNVVLEEYKTNVAMLGSNVATF